MLKISKLARELKLPEDAIMKQALALGAKLRQRGKVLTPQDADSLRKFYSRQQTEEPIPSKEDLPKEKKQVSMPDVTGIKDFAERLDVSVAAILKLLMQNGVLANINDEVDFDTAAIIADELGFQLIEESSEEDDQLEEIVGTENRLKELLAEQDPKKLKTRPPIVTVMGHVDHGKTSLLDAIRKTNVFGGEAGGITQHIGAYQVTIKKRKITFIDTPGHEAFTQMRARGAQVTDIAILVVAADDGVRPQTIEAMNHAKAAGVPIVVAINKIDKPGADLDRVKSDLAGIDLVPEEWGGKTICVPVSAKQVEGIEDLLEMILLVADLEDLKANPSREAVGTIIEARKTSSKGVVATVLVQTGTLRAGDPILVGSFSGRVKDMHNDQGKRIKEAAPAMPAEITGLPDVPEAGSILQVVDSDKTSQQLAKIISRKERALRLRPSSNISLENFYDDSDENTVKTLNLILKTDVKGSAEAIKESLKKLETAEVKVAVVHVGTGNISPSDISLAIASKAVIMGFNVKTSGPAQEMLMNVGVDVRNYSIIYEFLDDVRKAMGGLLSPEEITILRGRLEVKAIFSHNRDRWTVGGYLSEGYLESKDKVKIFRGEEQVSTASILSMQRETTEVDQVKNGVECGVVLRRVKGEILKGDTIDVYITEKRKRELV